MMETPGNGVLGIPAAADSRSERRSASTVAGRAAPHWVRLIAAATRSRLRGPMTASTGSRRHDDGQLASNVYVGLAVTAHDNTVACTTVFDSVATTFTPPPTNTPTASRTPTRTATAPTTTPTPTRTRAHADPHRTPAPATPTPTRRRHAPRPTHTDSQLRHSTRDPHRHADSDGHPNPDEDPGAVGGPRHRQGLHLHFGRHRDLYCGRFQRRAGRGAGCDREGQPEQPDLVSFRHDDEGILSLRGRPRSEGDLLSRRSLLWSHGEDHHPRVHQEALRLRQYGDDLQRPRPTRTPPTTPPRFASTSSPGFPC